MRRLVFSVGLLICVVASACASPAPPKPTDTGFSKPYSGPDRFENLAPTKATEPSQLNEPIGLRRADEIARHLGLKRELVLTDDQFRDFITGRGVGGSKAAAALADRTVQIFTNTNGNPLTSDVDGVPTETVLASYGLFVNRDGLLMSLANRIAPTRIANVLLTPVALCPNRPLCGYINTWFTNNNAIHSLIQLYRSAYLAEALYGNQAQTISGAAQLVPNTKGGVNTTVGMSMAPSLWLTNFALLYTLKPEIAARMPAYWTPIPTPVVDGIRNARDKGFVEYSDYASYFPLPSSWTSTEHREGAHG